MLHLSPTESFWYNRGRIELLLQLRRVWGYVQEGGWDFEDFDKWVSELEN